MRLITFLLLLVAPSLRAELIQGEIKLNYSESSSATMVLKRIREDRQSHDELARRRFYRQETVFAGISVKNTGSKPMFLPLLRRIF